MHLRNKELSVKNNLMDEYLNFSKFIKNNIPLLVVTMFFTIFSYGCLLFYYRISIDGETMLSNYEGTLGWLITLERFILVVIKKITDVNSFNTYSATFLQICLIFVFGIMWSYLVYYFSNNNKKFLWIFTIIFITYPTFAEQFYFVLQGSEVALAISLSALAVFFISKWILLKCDKSYFVLGIIFMVISFGTYQALVPLYISGVLAVFILYYINNINIQKYKFMEITKKYILSFLLGIFLYKLIGKLLIKIFRSTESTEYLSNQIKWKYNTFNECINNIYVYIKDMIWNDNYFSNRFYIVISIILLLSSIFYIIKRKNGSIIFLVANITFLISPFFLAIVFGSQTVPRTQLQFPLVIAIGAYIILIFLKNNNYKIIRVITLLYLCIIAFHQAQITSKFFYSDYIRYQQDVTLANKITYTIDQIQAEYDEIYPVVFIGRYDHKLPSSCIKGEAIGASFFDWYPEASTWEATDRVLSFMDSLGYKYKFPSEQDMDKGREISNDMPSWPNKDSIKLEDGIIVVKLSDSVR